MYRKRKNVIFGWKKGRRKDMVSRPIYESCTIARSRTTGMAEPTGLTPTCGLDPLLCRCSSWALGRADACVDPTHPYSGIQHTGNSAGFTVANIQLFIIPEFYFIYRKQFFHSYLQFLNNSFGGALRHPYLHHAQGSHLRKWPQLSKDF